MAEEAFEGMEPEDKTTLGFGSKSINRRLKIGDELFVLMKCEVVSDGRSKKQEDGGKMSYKAGAATTILAEVSAAEAARIAAS